MFTSYSVPIPRTYRESRDCTAPAPSETDQFVNGDMFSATVGVSVGSIQDSGTWSTLLTGITELRIGSGYYNQIDNIDVEAVGPSGAVPLPGSEPGPLAGLGGKGAVRSFDTIPNTGRFWQEYDIVGYLLAIALGCLLAWRWRRKEIHEEVYA